MTKINLTLSPSSINLYKSSQLVFYYTYILQAPPDTEVVECYGKAGNCVHEFLEDYSENKINDIENDFYEYWKQRDLFNLVGINNRPLDYNKYLIAVKRGIFILNNLTAIKTEESIEWPLYEDENFNIKVKGIIDLQCVLNNKRVIIDWKTSSHIDKGETFEFQGKFYAYLVYKKYGYIPDEVIFEYLKINKRKVFHFTKKDLMELEEYLNNLCMEIVSKGTDINKYEIGDINSIFNPHKLKCMKEKLRREKNNKIIVRIKNNKLFFDNLNKKLAFIIDEKYSYFVPGYMWSELYRKRIWDGKKHFFKNNSLPLAFLNDLKELINEYNKYYNKNYELVVIDERNERILNKTFSTKFKDSNIKLRDYQLEAVETALKKKIGIIYIGTGGGKSLIAAEIIRRLNKRSLFVVNRIELVTQTKEMFENYLGVEIGEMSEGNIDISHQITVASIQTLYSILKRRDESSEKLRLFLHNIVVTIYDEAQNLTDYGMYGVLRNNLNNNEYFIALTGTPWRSDNRTLEMNAVCGFVIYKKTTKELQELNYLTPVKCLFIDMRNIVNKINITNEQKIININNDYNNEYVQYVIYNETRNNFIKKLCNIYGKTKKILVLTRRIAHAYILNNIIENSIVITGATNKSTRKKDFQLFKEKNGIVLIGSVKIFSAGINIPDLDIIINASAHKSSVDSIQIIGRVMRKFERKKYGYFIDFVDQSNYLNTASFERMKILRKFENEVKIVDFTNITDYIE